MKHDKFDPVCPSAECQAKGPYPELQKTLIAKFEDALSPGVAQWLSQELISDPSPEALDRHTQAFYLAVLLKAPNDSMYQQGLVTMVNSALPDELMEYKTQVITGAIELLRTFVERNASELIDIAEVSLLRPDKMPTPLNELVDQAKAARQGKTAPGKIKINKNLH